MGQFLGVTKVKQLGRILGDVNPASYSGILSLLNQDESLVLLLNNGVRTIAAVIADEREHAIAAGSYKRGAWLNYLFLGLKTDDIEKCPDESWVMESRINF